MGRQNLTLSSLASKHSERKKKRERDGNPSHSELFFSLSPLYSWLPSLSSRRLVGRQQEPPQHTPICSRVLSHLIIPTTPLLLSPPLCSWLKYVCRPPNFISCCARVEKFGVIKGPQRAHGQHELHRQQHNEGYVFLYFFPILSKLHGEQNLEVQTIIIKH